MPITVKELIVVLVLATPVFYFGQSFALLFMSEADFARRRNVWYALTAAAFLIPNFWIFAFVAALILIPATKRDPNPSALYLFVLHAIPPASAPIPMIGLSSLFNLNINLLLSFCVLTPVAFQLLKSKPDINYQSLRPADISLAAYGILTSILYIHLQNSNGALFQATFTDFLRRALIFLFEIFVPYFVISRHIKKKTALKEALAAYCMPCAIMAVIAMFESLRRWLLYPEIATFWGVAGPTQYVMRGDVLRAMASSGHPLELGYLLAIAFGFWLFLQDSVVSLRRRLFGSLVFWLGLIAAYSRGPWLGAVAIYFFFAALSPKGARKVLQAAGLFAALLVAISLSPLADRIIRVVPFLGGTVDSGNIVYRERLFERSWSIISESPIFGDQDALLKMQDLRQGEGIIDLINAYLQILLDNGFVGLFLFLAFILVPTYRAFRASRRFANLDASISRLGASLVACALATLIMIESGGSDKVMISVLVGLMGAYACLRHMPNDDSPAPESRYMRFSARAKPN
jgi:O-antigen ligase